MSVLLWDQAGEREYETGTKKGVLFPIQETANDTGSKYTLGVAWNGLTGVTESPEGADPTDLYADDSKYITLRSAEKLNLTVTAYTYPDEFGECDGSATVAKGMKLYQQARKGFGLAYQTTKGNDEEYDGYGYIIHLAYGCTTSPSERAYKTVNDNPEAIEFSWGVTTTPVNVKIDNKEYKPTSLVTIDSTDFKTEQEKANLAKLEAIIYGSESKDPYLPMPEEVAAILEKGTYSKIAG